jgi:plasmid stabilization system protein ParE
MNERVVRTTPTADDDIRAIHAWWTANRTAAPNLFLSEFANAVSLIGAMPLIGKRYRAPGMPALRRYLLRSTRYHIYYTVSSSEVVLLTVWGAVRGTTPNFEAFTLK